MKQKVNHEDFMMKYYPGLKRKFHLQTIRNLEILLEEKIKEYHKLFGHLDK